MQIGSLSFSVLGNVRANATAAHEPIFTNAGHFASAVSYSVSFVVVVVFGACALFFNQQVTN